MNDSRVLAVLLSAALTLIGGGMEPFKPTKFKELVPEKTEALSKAAKESPFTIVVTVVPVDGERRVFLNKERVGTTADLNPLKEKLAQALERRRQAYRAGAGNERPGGADESM